MTTLYPEIAPYAHGMLDVADGNLIYCETCGNPRGKPVVVLHGGPGSGCATWHRRLFDPTLIASCFLISAIADAARRTPARLIPISRVTTPRI